VHETSIFCLNNANISDLNISQDILKVTKHLLVQSTLLKAMNMYQNGKVFVVQLVENVTADFQYLF
jgi:hypothetical protein